MATDPSRPRRTRSFPELRTAIETAEIEALSEMMWALLIVAAIEAVRHAHGQRRAWPISSILRRTHWLLRAQTTRIETWNATVVLDDTRIEPGAGLALEAVLKEPVPFSRRARNELLMAEADRIQFTRSLPGAVLREARIRAIRITAPA